MTSEKLQEQFPLQLGVHMVQKDVTRKHLVIFN